MLDQCDVSSAKEVIPSLFDPTRHTSAEPVALCWIDVMFRRRRKSFLRYMILCVIHLLLAESL